MAISERSKTRAMSHYYNLMMDKTVIRQLGIVQAPNREVAIDLWRASADQDPASKPTPGAAIPAPGTEAGRTHGEELPHTGPPDLNQTGHAIDQDHPDRVWEMDQDQEDDDNAANA